MFGVREHRLAAVNGCRIGVAARIHGRTVADVGFRRFQQRRHGQRSAHPGIAAAGARTGRQHRDHVVLRIDQHVTV